jgi:hypothetical protein
MDLPRQFSRRGHTHSQRGFCELTASAVILVHLLRFDPLHDGEEEGESLGFFFVVIKVYNAGVTTFKFQIRTLNSILLHSISSVCSEIIVYNYILLLTIASPYLPAPRLRLSNHIFPLKQSRERLGLDLKE